MTELDNLPHLLGQLADTRKQVEANLPADHRFNIFRVLRPEHDEVHLHSRFIGELLNPKGSHGIGTAFLRLFATHCGFAQHIHPVSLNYEKVRLRREHQNIDLLIDDGTHFIVIENKIYATDQRRQLERYHAEARKMGYPTLYYLTLKGHSPSAESLGNLAGETVQNISYENEITVWLDDCIAQTAHLPILHATLTQYQKLVQKLTGTAPAELQTQLISLLEQDQNGIEATLIGNNWHHIRHHVEFQFWTELEKLVATRYQVLPDARFSAKSIHEAIHQTRGRDTGYGIRATVGTVGGWPLQLKINRGGGRLDFGIPRPKDAKPGPNPETLNEGQRALDIVFNKSKETGFWLVQKDSTRNINFEAFANEETTQLINKETRHAAVAALWVEVQALVEDAVWKIAGDYDGGITKHIVS